MADDSESSAVYWYAWTTITYRCMTADGSQKDLSELLVWPCTYFNWSPDQLVIVPDYEGYGSTASYPHPYCNRELTAQQVVEGVKAGLAYFEKKVTSMEDDWSGVAIGYSQGGAIDTDPDMIALNCSYQDFVTDIGQECADSR